MLTDIIEKHEFLIGEIKKKMDNWRISKIENNYYDPEKNLSLVFQAKINENGSSFLYNISGKEIKEGSYETFKEFYKKLIKIYGFSEADSIMRGFLDEIAKRNDIRNKKDLSATSLTML